MIITRIGFTGTREGMTTLQRLRVVWLLQAFTPHEVHHGDCIGADRDFHEQAKNISLIVIHPPQDSSKRAWCRGGNVDHSIEPKPYLERDHDIVDMTQILIACPKGAVEEQRSGTWATIRYARLKFKPHFIVRPDGSMATEYPIWSDLR